YGDLSLQQAFMDTSSRGPILTNLQAQDILVRTSAARSNYHGLIVILRKQYTQGLAFDLSYTLSQSLDQSPISTQGQLTPLQSSYFPDIDYGPSLFDIRHLFKATGLHHLPFGRGQRLRFGNSSLNRLISGWFTAGILTAQSGLPLTVIQDYSYGPVGGSVYGG